MSVPMLDAELDWRHLHSLYLSGDYEACRGLLRANSDPRAQILLARIDGRIMRKEASLERLLSLSIADERLAAERDVWIAAAYQTSREPTTAYPFIERALRVLHAPDAAFFRAQHTLALALFYESRYDESWNAVSVLLESPDFNDRAQAHALRSWIFAKRDTDLRAQARELLASLEFYERAAEPDQFTFSRAVYTLSTLCREIGVQDAVQPVRRNFARVRLCEATASVFFQTMRVLGWVDALEGDELSAMRRWREAEACAPTDFWRVFCVTDRAYLADAMRRAKTAQELLLEADRQAQRLSWSTTQDEERLILLTIAQLYASREPARAERYLAIYRSLSTDVDQRMGVYNDPRGRALQLQPRGSALLELGERDIAVPMLEEAHAIFAGFGYGWRAALCAHKLFQAGSGELWLRRARKHIAPWPNSWVARDIANAV